MQLTFKVKCRTNFGQEVFVIGSLDALGLWDTTRARSLTYSSDDWWYRKSVTLPPCSSFEYKYIVKEGAKVQWEGGANRTFWITDDRSTATHIITEDVFGSPQLTKIYIDNELSTAATFANLNNQQRAQQTNSQSRDTENTLQITPRLPNDSTAPSVLLTPVKSSNSVQPISFTSPSPTTQLPNLTTSPSIFSPYAARFAAESTLSASRNDSNAGNSLMPSKKSLSYLASELDGTDIVTPIDSEEVPRRKIEGNIATIDDTSHLMRRIAAVADMSYYEKEVTPRGRKISQSERIQLKKTPPNSEQSCVSTQTPEISVSTPAESERITPRKIGLGVDIFGEDLTPLSSGGLREFVGIRESDDGKNSSITIPNIKEPTNVKRKSVGLFDEDVPSQEKAPGRIRKDSDYSFTFSAPFRKPGIQQIGVIPKSRKIEEFIEQVANNDLEISPLNPLLNREELADQVGFWNKFILALQANTNITRIVYPTNRTIAQNKTIIMEFTTALKRANSIGNVSGISLFVNVCGEKIPEAFHVHANRLGQVCVKWCPLSLEIAHAWAAFIKDTEKLKYLTLNVGREGADNDTCGMLIGEALERNRSIEVAKLRSNDFGEKTALQLARVLRFNTTLTHLDLSYNNLTLQGFRVFFKAISSTKILRTLVLKDCEIDDKCVKKLGASLKVNTSLTNLNLFSNNLGSIGAKYIAEALVKNCTLQFLDLYANKIDQQGAEEFAKMLKVNCGLEILSLQSNGIKSAAITSIYESLSHNSTLKSLNLANNSVKNSEAALCKMISMNNSLTKLDLRFTDANRQVIETAIKSKKSPLEITWLF